MDYEKIKEKTYDIVHNKLFEEGMFFTEMYHYWIVIINVDKEEQKLKYVSSIESFKMIHQTTFDLLSKKLKYETKESCWVDYTETDIDKKNKLLSNVSSEMDDIERRKYNLSMML